MAIVNIFGCESGDLSELSASSGTLSASTTQKRTGTYALRQNPTAGLSLAEFGKFSAGGTIAVIGSSTAHIRISVYIATAPASEVTIFELNTAAARGGTSLFQVLGGGPNWRGGTGSWFTSLGVSFDIGQWYDFYIKYVNGNASVSITTNGTTTSTDGLTASPGTIDYFSTGHGTTGNSTYDMYIDDLAIDTSTYISPGKVNIIVPDSAGTNAAWTNGSGTTFAVVDEIPHNSDTDYLMETGVSGTHDFNMQSSATGGISSAISAVKLVGIVRNVAVGAGSVAMWSKSGGTTTTETAWTTGSTTYKSLQIVKTTANSGEAWTTGILDSLQVGVVNNNANDARCTALYAMVWWGSSTWTPKQDDSPPSNFFIKKYNTTPLIISVDESSYLLSNSVILYLQNVSGDIAALTGNLTRNTLKSLTGVSGSLTGVLTKLISKPMSGVAGSLTGTLSRITIKSFYGAVGALTGALAAGILYARDLSGAVGNLTGSLVRTTLKSLFGATGAYSGTLTRNTLKSVSGVTGSLSATVSKLTTKSFSGAISTITGALSVAAIYARSLTGTMGSLSGSVTPVFLAIVNLAGSVGTMTGSISRVTYKVLSGAAGNLTGALSRGFLVALVGVIQTLSGSLKRDTYKPLSGSTDLSGSLSRNTLKSLTGTMGTLSGVVSTIIVKLVSLAGSISLTGTISSLVHRARARMKAGTVLITKQASGTVTRTMQRAGNAVISKMRGGNARRG